MITPIIDPVDVKLLKKELNQETFLRKTNRGDNEIYVVNNENAPNVLREIGRLREISFRAVGGGSGTECDLDHLTLKTKPVSRLWSGIRKRMKSSEVTASPAGRWHPSMKTASHM